MVVSTHWVHGDCQPLATTYGLLLWLSTLGTWVLSALDNHSIWSCAVVVNIGDMGTMSAIRQQQHGRAVVVNIGDMGTHVSNVATTAYGHVLWLSTLGTWVLSAMLTTTAYGRAVVVNIGDSTHVNVDNHSNRPYGLLLWLSVPMWGHGYCQQ